MIAPASTLKLVDKSDIVEKVEDEQRHGFPVGTHWADLTDEGTILVIEQPRHQSCAAVGGIMAARMKVKGLLGCVVSGRVRDIGELKRSGLPVSLYLDTFTCTCLVWMTTFIFTFLLLSYIDNTNHYSYNKS